MKKLSAHLRTRVSRTDKLNELLQREVATCIAREIEFDSQTVVTVTRVDTEQTLEHATVYITVFPTVKRGDALSILRKRLPFIQDILNHRLSLRHVPRFMIAFDDEAQALYELDELLNKI